MVPISHLDTKTYNAVKNLVDELPVICGDGLLSVYIYGSAAGKGYIPERSNINTLIVLKRIETETLKGISGIYRKSARSRIVSPLVLTPDYIRSSVDVFPIEFLDMKEKSILLYGHDLLKEIAMDLSQLREECEREIKGQMVRFRGTFIEVEGDRNGMERLVATAVSNIIFPLKNVLRLLKLDIPDESEAVISSCCRALSLPDKPLIDAWGIKKGNRKVAIDDLYHVIAGYMDSLEAISGKIDSMKSEGRI